MRHGAWSLGCAESIASLPNPAYRLLLDQHFPERPGFAIADLDRTIDVEAVRRFDPQLVQARTPDWYIYLRAAEAGYDGLVTRDWHQTELPEEMWVLSRLPITIISWKKPMDDLVTEWGHLLAYLPELKQRIDVAKGSVILLPVPRLTADNLVKPGDALGRLANERGVSVGQIRDEARASVSEWLQGRQLGDRYDALLQLDSRTANLAYSMGPGRPGLCGGGGRSHLSFQALRGLRRGLREPSLMRWRLGFS